MAAIWQRRSDRKSAPAGALGDKAYRGKTWIAAECRKADDHMSRLGGNIVRQRGRKTHATKTIVAFVVQRRDVSGYRQFEFRPGRTIADRRQRGEAVRGWPR